MSSTGTTTVGGQLETALSSIWGPIETWAEGLIPTTISFLTGLAASFTTDQIVIVGKVAASYKAALVAGQSQAQAYTAALNTLSSAELGELNNDELSLLDFLISISGSVPTTTTAP
jgi:hypothetical protein